MSLREATTRRQVVLALLLVGGLSAAWVGYGSFRAAAYRETHIERFRDDSPPVAVSDDGIGADGVIGVLEIPRLGVREVVRSGDDDETLDIAIGHLADTPFPWARGNSVLAAHRDTHFRELRHIQAGDVVRLRTPKGVFEYIVHDRMIVNPEDVWVMAPSDDRRLTLVTCYPFSYIGPAPQRFIVQAVAR